MSGANAGIEALVPLAKGKGDMKLAGIYLNKGRFILTVMFVVLYFLCFFIESLLLVLRQDPEVCKVT